MIRHEHKPQDPCESWCPGYGQPGVSCSDPYPERWNELLYREDDGKIRAASDAELPGFTSTSWDESWLEDNGTIRQFDTGATRDTAEGKLEPWGFGSALVDLAYAEYMHENRIQSDGSLRASDNWKKGIPRDAYWHSLSRHIQDLRLIIEGFPEKAREQDIVKVLCAIKFNVDGLLYETLKARDEQKEEA